MDVPNSDKALPCLVNLNGHAAHYAPDRWVDIPLVTDLKVTLADHPNPLDTYRDILGIYERHNPEALVGRYISGGRVKPITRYPAETIHSDSIPENWRRGGDWVNLADVRVAKCFADLIINECQRRKRPIWFVDNIIHPSAMKGWTTWADTCSFLWEIRCAANISGSLLIANIAAAPWGMSEQDVDLLSRAVDGMSFEMPFHELARNNRERTVRQIEVYRLWLRAGKIVILIPVSNAKRQRVKDREAAFIAGFAALLREPGDPLFVAWPFWAQRPAWASFPRDFGLPFGGYWFKRDHVLTRRFENGELILNTRRTKVKVKVGG